MPQTYKLALLDDYQKVALKMADWDRLKKRGVEITVFHEAFSSVEDAARKLAPFDMLGLLRERTAFPRALIEKLPNLKFMVLTGARASSLDDKAATDRGIPISNTPGGGSNASTAELSWALLMMCARDLAKGERLMRAGQVAVIALVAAALGGLVGLELALDPLVQGDQHPGSVGGGVDVDRPQRPELPHRARVEGCRLGCHRGASVSWFLLTRPWSCVEAPAASGGRRLCGYAGRGRAAAGAAACAMAHLLARTGRQGERTQDAASRHGVSQARVSQVVWAGVMLACAVTHPSVADAAVIPFTPDRWTLSGPMGLRPKPPAR
jgi:hypothetical protein